VLLLLLPQARAWGGGKQHFVGSFTSEVDAARAYDKVRRPGSCIDNNIVLLTVLLDNHTRL
jgi:hypothetical protein